MRKVLICGLLLALAFLPAADALGQAKKGKLKQIPADPATPLDYQALNKVPTVVGQVTGFDPIAKTLTVRVEYPVPDPNGQLAQKYYPNGKMPKGNASNAWVRLLIEYQKILVMTNPKQQQKKLNQFMVKLANQQQKDMFNFMLQMNQMQAPLQQQLARNMGYTAPYNPLNPGTAAVTLAKEFELVLATDVGVARKDLEMQYDDKGNIKQYTAEELKKLRDPKLPGYTAKIEDVMSGQQVVLYLKKQETKAKDDKAKEDKAKDDKGKDDRAKDDKGKEDKGSDPKAGDAKGKSDPPKEEKAKDDKAAPRAIKSDLPTDVKAKVDQVKDDKAKDDKGKDAKGKEGDPPKAGSPDSQAETAPRPGPLVTGIVILTDVSATTAPPKKKNN